MSFIKDIVGGITGSTQADAARDSAGQQVAAANQAIGTVGDAAGRAQGFFNPFQAIGQQGLSQAGFLGDPNAQFDFLQSNPLFQMGLDNLNQSTNASAAARGRLSSGDTLQQLTNNSLLAAQPLLDRQRQDILAQLGIGTGIAGNQAQIEQNLGSNIANLQTGIGAAQAAGTVGAANARAGGLAGQLGGSLGGGLISAFTGGVF